MFQEVKAVLSRSSDTIWKDVAGGTALMVVLLAGLHLPGVL